MISSESQVAVAANEHQAGVLIPAPAQTTAALPEETAWQMIAYEGGALALCLAIGVTVLWRVISKVWEETRAQTKELIAVQGQALQALKEAVQKVEGAIRMSDANNTNAVGRLSDVVSSAVARIDRHDLKLEAHHESLQHHSSRLNLLESRRRTPDPIPPGAPR